MQAGDLSLADLLGLNLRTYDNLGLAADSAARVVAHGDLTDEEKVKLNIILGYISAKTGKPQVAAAHYMSAFNVGRACKLDVHLVMAAGIGVVLALIAQQDYLRARHTVTLLEAVVDGNPATALAESVLLDQLLEQIGWRLADVA